MDDDADPRSRLLTSAGKADRRATLAGVLRGVDVSDWQGDVDWAAVATWGQFAVCKATEGTGNVQSTFGPNRAGMVAAGLGPVGLYHFARPENGNPIGEANHFLNVVGELGPDEFAVLDIETANVGSWPAFIRAWCGRVHDALGRSPVVYMSESPAKSMPDECAIWPLWVAGYVSYQPSGWEDWRVGPWETPVMWQYSSSGSVPGIGGRCDVNIAPDDLRARLALEEDDMYTDDDRARDNAIARVVAASTDADPGTPSLLEAIAGVENAMNAKIDALSAKVDKLVASHGANG